MPVKTATGESVPMLMSAVAGVGPGGEITFLVTHARDFPAAPRAPRGSGAARSLDCSAASAFRRVRAPRRRPRTAGALALLQASVEGMPHRRGSGPISAKRLARLAYRMTQVHGLPTPWRHRRRRVCGPLRTGATRVRRSGSRRACATMEECRWRRRQARSPSMSRSGRARPPVGHDRSVARTRRRPPGARTVKQRSVRPI
jgi:hypothetical protein